MKGTAGHTGGGSGSPLWRGTGGRAASRLMRLSRYAVSCAMQPETVLYFAYAHYRRGSEAPFSVAACAATNQTLRSVWSARRISTVFVGSGRRV